MAHSPAFEALCDDARSRIREVTLAEYLADPDAWTLVDVREESEFAAFSVPDSVHLGKGVLERDAQKHFALDAPLLLMCGGGFRSALSADALQTMGFDAVASLAGGIKGWWRRLAEELPRLDPEAAEAVFDADDLSGALAALPPGPPGGSAVAGLSVRAPLYIAGDLHVRGDLDVREPVVVGGRLTVDGLFEASAPLAATSVSARSIVLRARLSAAGSVAADIVVGDLRAEAVRARIVVGDPEADIQADLHTWPESARGVERLPPAFLDGERADWAAVARAFAAGRIRLPAG